MKKMVKFIIKLGKIEEIVHYDDRMRNVDCSLTENYNKFEL